ncbi:MAG: hypothetical protein D6757_06335 [Alphaproteobacteria bacterium]|nr:MAG: hypothetical protein D6757_06335 [Alphaproteobacteria bacterium]
MDRGDETDRALDPDPLAHVIAERLSRPAGSAGEAAARHIADRHGRSVHAVLFYGSCLRTGVIEDRVLDFHVLVSDYRSAYPGRPFLALANRLLPPNVFYDEFRWPAHGREQDAAIIVLRSKYNVLSFATLDRWVRPECANVTIWARFAQPMALALIRDEESRVRVVAAARRAVLATLAAALPLCEAGADAAVVWACAFDLTYSAELRSEPPGKGREIYEFDSDYYDALFAPALEALGWPYERDPAAAGGVRIHAAAPELAARARRRWRWRRVIGKALSLARLVKGAFTFDGGAEYLAWKIRRHSGVEITLTPFQRRHPVIAGLMLFWRLRRRGAFR